MIYIKNNWNNGTTPAISAENLNKMDQGILESFINASNAVIISSKLGEQVNDGFGTVSKRDTAHSDNVTYTISNGVLTFTRVATDSNGHWGFIALPTFENNKSYIISFDLNLPRGTVVLGLTSAVETMPSYLESFDSEGGTVSFAINYDSALYNAKYICIKLYETTAFSNTNDSISIRNYIVSEPVNYKNDVNNLKEYSKTTKDFIDVVDSNTTDTIANGILSVTNKASAHLEYIETSISNGTLTIERNEADVNAHYSFIELPTLDSGESYVISLDLTITQGNTPYKPFLTSEAATAPTDLLDFDLLSINGNKYTYSITFTKSNNDGYLYVGIQSTRPATVNANDSIVVSNFSIRKYSINTIKGEMDNVLGRVSMAHSSASASVTATVTNNVLTITRVTANNGSHLTFIELPILKENCEYEISLDYTVPTGKENDLKIRLTSNAGTTAPTIIKTFNNSFGKASIQFVYSATTSNAKYVCIEVKYTNNPIPVADDEIVVSNYLIKSIADNNFLALLTNNNAKLKLATYNLGKFAFGLTPSAENDVIVNERLQTWKKALARYINADVLSLCEYVGYMDSAQTIRTDSTLFFPIYDSLVTHATSLAWSTQALASRLPILNVEKIVYTITYEDVEYTRNWLKLTIIVGGYKVVVFSIHLTPHKQDAGDGDTDGSAIRAIQAAHIIELASDYDRVIICGDFNAMTIDEYDIWKEAGYNIANGGYLGIANTHQFVEVLPLDNIITTPNIIIDTWEVPDVYDMCTSDHLPVVAELTIK